MKTITRRKFIHTSATLASFAISGTRVSGNIPGPTTGSAWPSPGSTAADATRTTDSPAFLAFGENHVVADTMQNIEDNLKVLIQPLDGLTYRIGKLLEFNPDSVKFINQPEADALLTRKYRKAFALPGKI